MGATLFDCFSEGLPTRVMAPMTGFGFWFLGAIFSEDFCSENTVGAETDPKETQ